MDDYIYIWIFQLSFQWAIECNDCILEHFFSKKWYLGDDTKLHLMVKLQFWRSGECKVFILDNLLQLLPGPLKPIIVVPYRILSMGQIELCENYNYKIKYLNPYNCNYFASRRVTWRYTWILRIVISLLKPYNYIPTFKRNIYLKPYNYSY